MGSGLSAALAGTIGAARSSGSTDSDVQRCPRSIAAPKGATPRPGRAPVPHGNEPDVPVGHRWLPHDRDRRVLITPHSWSDSNLRSSVQADSSPWPEYRCAPSASAAPFTNYGVASNAYCAAARCRPSA